MSLLDCAIEHGWGEDEDGAAKGVPKAADWLKVPPGDIVPVTLLLPLDQQISYLGHWWPPLRQYRPCTAPRCALCYQRVGKVRRFVQVALDERGKQFLWEFSTVQAGQIKTILCESGLPLAGLAVRLIRPPAQGNPLLLVCPGEPWLAPESLPEPVDAAGLLGGVWARQNLIVGKISEEPTPLTDRSDSVCPKKSAESSPDSSSPKSQFVRDYERKTGRPFKPGALGTQSD